MNARHVERSRDISLQNPMAVPRDLIPSLSIRSACGLPVHVAASPACSILDFADMTGGEILDY